MKSSLPVSERLAKSLLCLLILLDFLWTSEEGNMFDAFYARQHFWLESNN